MPGASPIKIGNYMHIHLASDPHFGHKNILEFGGREVLGATTSEEHDEALVQAWNKKVTKKRSRVYLLGDIGFTLEALQQVGRLHGEIFIILGNHDTLWKPEDLPGNAQIMNTSLFRYKRMWLSHCPIHPQEMRRCYCNVHGHVHMKSVPDPRYFNVCMDQLPDCAPISLDELRLEFLTRGIDLMKKDTV